MKDELMERLEAMRAIPPLDYEGVNRRLSNRIAELNAIRHHASATELQSRAWGRWVVGAVVCTALVLGYVWMPKLGTGTHLPTANIPAYVTAPGQRATVKLSDGTVVNLNVATRVSVPAGFGKTHRTLELDGEAQFIVTHNAKLPFSVKANGTVVRDLATVFAVRAYKGITQTRIAVRDGLVSVQTPTLTAANAVRVARNNSIEIGQDGVFKLSQIAQSDESYFSWTDGKLVLRQQPLGTALGELSRWYGLEFRTGDPKLLGYNVSAQLTERFQMSDMQDIADIIGAKAVRNGNTVVFYPRTTN